MSQFGTVDRHAEESQELPYLLWLALSLAGAGLMVLASAAVGGISPSFDRWIWILILGIWVSRSQVERLWDATRGPGPGSRLWTSTFVGTILVAGFVFAAAFADGRHDRGLVVHVVLLTAFTGGELVDFVVQRTRKRQG